MQAKLHRWAVVDGGCRIDDLFNLVHDPAFLHIAWDRVASNKGARSAGVDGRTVASIERSTGAKAFLEDLRSALKEESFSPSPVREKMIPKANGKLRRLGIPTVEDRVVQSTLKLVLEPIFEADFRPCSYGFRPRRRAHDAIAEIQFLATRSYEWVLEADIEACFDNISHTFLMDRVRKRVGDKRVLRLIKKFLKAGILTELGMERDTYTGTPQGGILSPLLSNIALSALDDYFAEEYQQTMATTYQRTKRGRNGDGVWRICRYADDFVIMISGTRAHAEALREVVAQVLAPIGLGLSETKTSVCHIDEGFDFLGFRIQRKRKRGSHKRYVYTFASEKSVAGIRRKVKALTYRSMFSIVPGELIHRINQMLRGWANYFKHAVVKHVFSSLGWYARTRVSRWLRERHKGRKRMPWKEFRRRYIVPEHGLIVAGTELFNPGTVPVTRYRYRGDTIPTPWASPRKTPA
ncbi:group II intron reverse transcriptase/maturase [Actinoallomurus acaciae]|uniref:Group II intron reverse transcriptase/maturase n=1 Tax=Actinoallomurus acaciae TaxID=502577 RepID=A0ABV5YXY1_9ACTN